MTDSVDTAPKKAKSPLWKRLYFGFTALVLVALAADTIWVASGTGEWKLAKDADGVKVYTLKAPGDKLLKVKTVMEGDYTLTQLTSQHIVDDNLETCKSWIPDCVEFTRIQDFDPVRGYDKDMWRLNFPAPFDDRELLITTIFAQDKATKQVALDVVAIPNTLPLTKGVVRVERMHNRWTFTPQPNGKVEVLLIQDNDLLGFFPYFLLNMVIVDESHKFFATELRTSLKKDKYVHAKLDFIDDIR